MFLFCSRRSKRRSQQEESREAGEGPRNKCVPLRGMRDISKNTEIEKPFRNKETLFQQLRRQCSDLEKQASAILFFLVICHVTTITLHVTKDGF
jgi:hypothetical protein